MELLYIILRMQIQLKRHYNMVQMYIDDIDNIYIYKYLDLSIRK